MKTVVIHDDCGRPYLIRMVIFEAFGFAIKLHTIIQSDRERELHDHPWSFLTLMLSDGYYEETPANKTPEGLKNYKLGDPTVKIWHGTGALRFCRSPYPHRLELRESIESAYHAPADKQKTTPYMPAVTLVLMFPRWREWGFYSRDGFIHWKKYVNARSCNE